MKEGGLRKLQDDKKSDELLFILPHITRQPSNLLHCRRHHKTQTGLNLNISTQTGLNLNILSNFFWVVERRCIIFGKGKGVDV